VEAPEQLPSLRLSIPESGTGQWYEYRMRLLAAANKVGGKKLQFSDRQLQISDWGDMGVRFLFAPK